MRARVGGYSATSHHDAAHTDLLQALDSEPVPTTGREQGSGEAYGAEVVGFALYDRVVFRCQTVRA